MTPDEAVAAGLYDPATDPADRIELLNLLVELGASVDEMREARAEYRLRQLASDITLHPRGELASLEDVARRAGLPVADMLRISRALGFPDPAPNERRFTDEDVEIASTLRLAVELGLPFDVVLQMARVIGSAMAKVADAEIALIRANVESPMRDAQVGEAELARALTTVATEMLPRIQRVLQVVHLHHLRVAERRETMMEVGGMNTADLVVGFADLVGFTRYSEDLTATQLATFLSAFEARTAEIVAQGGARIVKLIGDEVMFVADSAAAGCAVACDLIGEFGGGVDAPTLRAGLAAGPVLVRDGDYFGRVVNVASRLARVAEPATVVADGEVRTRLDGDKFVMTPIGTRELRGVSAPVAVYVVARTA